MKNNHNKAPQIPIRQIATAFQQSRILLSAFELDFFTIIGDGEKTSDQVAEAAGTDLRATGRVLNALSGFGLLEKKEGFFSNTPAALQCLVRGRPGYLGGLNHTSHLWETWSSLTEVIRSGTPSHKDEINDRGPEWLRAFIRAMHDRGKVQAAEIARSVDLKGVSRILDVGGGSGVFSFAFVDAAEGARSVVFDLPAVVPITEEYIMQHGYKDRVFTQAGDYHSDDLGRGYDLVFLSAIVHINSYEENRELVARCAKVLNPGGRLVIQDWIMDDERTSPLAGAVFAINMLVGTAHGDTYTAGEMIDWMSDAGLSKLEVKDTSFGTGLVIGYRL